MTTEPSTDVDLVVCDVCHTLYRLNTTADFLRFVCRRSSWGRRLGLWTLQSRKLPVLYGTVVAGKLAGRDIGRDLQLKMLGGIARRRLRRLARQWLVQRDRERRHDVVWDLVGSASDNGAELVLASASVDPVIEAVADQLDAEFFCSQLEYDDQEVCTGRLDFDITGRKHQSLQHRIDEAERVMVISDNETDAPLLRQADQPVVVRRHSGQPMRKWERLMGDVRFAVV